MSEFTWIIHSFLPGRQSVPFTRHTRLFIRNVTLRIIQMEIRSLMSIDRAQDTRYHVSACHSLSSVSADFSRTISATTATAFFPAGRNLHFRIHARARARAPSDHDSITRCNYSASLRRSEARGIIRSLAGAHALLRLSFAGPIKVGGCASAPERTSSPASNVGRTL